MEPIYIYHFPDWTEHKTGPVPSSEDFDMIDAGHLEIIKVENKKVYEAHANGAWVEMEKTAQSNQTD